MKDKLLYQCKIRKCVDKKGRKELQTQVNSEYISVKIVCMARKMKDQSIMLLSLASISGTIIDHIVKVTLPAS
jgi:hypothetical protein